MKKMLFTPAVERLGSALAALLVLGIAAPGHVAHAAPAHRAGSEAVLTNPPQGSVVRITSAVSGRCLEADMNTINQLGTKVQLWGCLPNAYNQMWRVVLANGGVELVNLQSNRCLDADINSDVNGTRVQLWDCNGTYQQGWTFSGAGNRGGISNNAFFNRHPNGPCMLDADLNSLPWDGTWVQLWSPNGQPQQEWIWTNA
ncbi:RICIN domain-containing protein [Micromonospora sp. NPDC049559]|uniref:RICIN domain-containing protein n=1 Tax=Micromonospora sp. NPDC049559 TaxID=3155923 RepID=UPI00343A07F3